LFSENWPQGNHRSGGLSKAFKSALGRTLLRGQVFPLRGTTAPPVAIWTEYGGRSRNRFSLLDGGGSINQQLGRILALQLGRILFSVLLRIPRRIEGLLGAKGHSTGKKATQIVAGYTGLGQKNFPRDRAPFGAGGASVKPQWFLTAKKKKLWKRGRSKVSGIDQGPNCPGERAFCPRASPFSARQRRGD